MSRPPTVPPAEAGDSSLRVETLSPENRPAVTRLAASAWDRSHRAEALAWRLEASGALTASVAISRGECVACVFAMKRRYWSRTGPVEVLEPFDWYTDEAWRPKGAGVRVMKHLLSSPVPVIPLGGSEAAQRLLARLGYRHAWTAKRWVLPLRGAFLAWRGRPPLLARAFDAVAPLAYRPRAGRHDGVRAEPASNPGAALDQIIQDQQRFDLVPRPDAELRRWFHGAPAEMGLYLGFNLLAGGTMVGWAWGRVVTAEGLRFGDIQDLILADDAIALYPAAVRQVAAALAGFGVDAVFCTTSCPDTQAALARCRFRYDDTLPVFARWPDGEPPARALITSGHTEHAFFPTPTAAESAWAGG
jgi:hypothetical protein